MEGPPQMMVAAPMQAVPVPTAVPAGDIFGPGPLMVEQYLDLEEILAAAVGVGYEKANKYNVKGAAAGPMFMHEESGCIQRQCFGNHREADVYLRLGTNEQGPVVVRMHKNCHIGGPYDCCCRLNAEIYDSTEKQIGTIYNEQWAEWCCQLSMQLKDMNDNVKNKIQACLCQAGLVCLCCDVVFNINDAEGQATGGRVTKKFNGLKELFAHTNNFQVEFPTNADANDKAIIVGGAIALDFLMFEGNS